MPTDDAGHDTETHHTLTRGFTRVQATVTPDGRIRVTKYKRKHKFGDGFIDVGPERELYEGHVMDAELLGAMLKKVFESDGE